MAPNKTLAAQLANEFRELLPNNAVEYFVSYYDYYQPEAYIPQTDTYIEKDSSAERGGRAPAALDDQLAAHAPRPSSSSPSVSCIYGLGTPQEYVDRMARLRVGQTIDRDDLLRKFVAMQYSRNDLAFTRGTFRVRGDTVEIIPMYEELAVRVEFFGDEIDRNLHAAPAHGEILREEEEMYVFRRRTTSPGRAHGARDRRHRARARGPPGRAREAGQAARGQRLRMRTTYDVEMMRQVGSCSGIENYSRHIDGRAPGSAPNCLLDYFPRTSCSSSTSRTRPCRRSAACTRATCRASGCWWSTASGCPAPPTTAR
jgi:excinuclease ABC subunit B